MITVEFVVMITRFMKMDKANEIGNEHRASINKVMYIF